MNSCIEPDETGQLPRTLTIEIPCRMAQRAEAYARQNGMNLENVVIEALDRMLRQGNNP